MTDRQSWAVVVLGVILVVAPAAMVLYSDRPPEVPDLAATLHSSCLVGAGLPLGPVWLEIRPDHKVLTTSGGPCAEGCVTDHPVFCLPALGERPKAVPSTPSAGDPPDIDKTASQMFLFLPHM